MVFSPLLGGHPTRLWSPAFREDGPPCIRLWEPLLQGWALPLGGGGQLGPCFLCWCSGPHTGWASFCLMGVLVLDPLFIALAGPLRGCVSPKELLRGLSLPAGDRFPDPAGAVTKGPAAPCRPEVIGLLRGRPGRGGTVDTGAVRPLASPLCGQGLLCVPNLPACLRPGRLVAGGRTWPASLLRPQPGGVSCGRGVPAWAGAEPAPTHAGAPLPFTDGPGTHHVVLGGFTPGVQRSPQGPRLLSEWPRAA